MQTEDTRKTLFQITLHLIPFLFFCYVVSYLDRVNIAFAALTMKAEIGLTDTMFGFTSGVFYIGYILFGIPLNLALHRVGARRWIGCILITWGLASTATLFAVGPLSFALARFMLGAAESGFVPGVFLYLTYWFPAERRAKATAAFMLGIPVANIIGGPVSTSLLKLDGLQGLHGWQWLLLVEALPAMVLGVTCFFVLPDKPTSVSWLSTDEKAWLSGTLERERSALQRNHLSGLAQTLTNKRVLQFAAINLCGIMGSVGIGLWLPLLLKSYGLSNTTVGYLSAVPYLAGGIAMYLAPRVAPLLGGHRRTVAFSLAIAAVGLILCAASRSLLPSVLALSIAVSGIMSFQPNFWSLPSTFLTGRAAAGGIALMVSIGNLGGFLGPYLVGWLKDLTHNFIMALLAIAACLLFGALLMLIVGDPDRTVPLKVAGSTPEAA